MGLRTVNWCETSLDVDFLLKCRQGLRSIQAHSIDTNLIVMSIFQMCHSSWQIPYKRNNFGMKPVHCCNAYCWQYAMQSRLVSHSQLPLPRCKLVLGGAGYTNHTGSCELTYTIDPLVERERAAHEQYLCINWSTHRFTIKGALHIQTCM